MVDVLDHYRESGLLEKVRRILWHDNDTPMHIDPKTGNLVGADGKELLLYHHALKDGSIDLDMSKMISKLTPRGWENWDFTIDNQYNHVVRDIIVNPDGTRTYQHFEFWITPNDTCNKAREVIKIAVDANGHAKVPSGTDLSRFFEIRDGKVVQLARFVEVAHIEADGRATVLATSVGRGVEKVVTEGVPTYALSATPSDVPGVGHHFVLTGSPLGGTEFTPPVMPGSAPAIPTVVTPRHPLGPYKRGFKYPLVYYEGGAGIPEERKKIFEENRSPTLKENPNAVLNPQKEVGDYFKRQKPGYMAEIKILSGQITEVPSDHLRAVVCIPVAGHQEGRNIYRTLENYTFQDAPKDQYEILLFVNYPQFDRDGNPIHPDDTMDEIHRFKTDHPDMPIRVVTRVMQADQVNIGAIRKYLNDIALYRNSQRGSEGVDIILISNDADNRGIAPKYISNFLKKFDENPTTDGMLGQLDWDPEAYVKYPLVHIGTRLFQYLGAIGRFRSGGMPSSGANFAFRGSIYAGIGGYLPELVGGEDIAIGQAIIAARDDYKRVIFAGANVSRLYTSARRAIDALRSGLSPLEQWNKGFSVFDDEIRKMQDTSGRDINYDDPNEIKRLKEGLEVILDRTLKVYESSERLGKDSPYYRKAIGLLGIDYIVSNGEVKIESIDRLVRDLKHYQKIGVLLRDIKAGKGTPGMLAELHRLEAEFISESAVKRRLTQRRLAAKTSELNKRFSLFKQNELANTSSPLTALVENAAVHLDASKEMADYLTRQDADYFNQLQDLDSQIAERMGRNTRIIVCIPVAGHQEGRNIYKTIRFYARQSLPNNQFEVVLFVNSPQRLIVEKAEEIRTTLKEIERAKEDYPALKLRVVTAALPDDQVRIGNIRKIVTDLAILRAERAGIKNDVLLISNDADNEGLSPDYLRSYNDYFEQHPDREGGVGNLQFDPQSFSRFPVLGAAREFVTLLDQQGFKAGNIDLFGSNSAMKASIYCGIGGYPTALIRGEQEWTGDTIRQLRKTRDTLGYIDKALLVTSSRRGILSYTTGEVEQIAFGDEQAEARMRGLDVQSYPYFDYSREEVVAEMREELTDCLNRIICDYERGDRLGKDSRFYRSNLRRIGINYEVIGDPKSDESRIRLTDIQGFIERQKRIAGLIKAGETDMAKIYEQVSYYTPDE
jgi:hypothetical protein